ncbi:MAG: undecaprenyl-diphosphate phosphatase [Sedimenticolaceae bacterium]|nr:undecaprenyl-diphosphate phosphatase [Sedimenticolaceae bacterium]
MDLFQIILLALIQGLTEFLPISSSAHLALAPVIMGVEDQGLAFDISVHLGSLLAVILYFRKELSRVTADTAGHYLLRHEQTQYSKLGMAIIIATLPIILFGGLKTLLDIEFRSPVLIAWMSILFGLLLWWADTKPRRYREMEDYRFRDALIIGLFQVLAILPGTSRSGITMTAALMLGFTRTAASHFSFLLAVPTILMSSAVLVLDIIKSGERLDTTAMLIGAIFSFVFAWLAIHWFLKLVERTGMLPYIIYRVLLGVILLYIFL